MITGRKVRRADEAGADARRAAPIALLVAVGLGLAASVALMAQPPAAVGSFEVGQEQHDDD
jgi:hypothetical protein